VLIDVFVPAVESPLPLAVVDEDERLVGVIPRVTLLAALGPGPDATGEITLPHEPVPTSIIDQVLADSEPDVPAADTKEAN
jgi:glycine betaine/proline transport system ATP-binding protein